MEICFLDKIEDSARLILIFPGWSFGKQYYTDIHFEGWNIAIVEDYRSPSIDLSPLREYSTIYLFAWSLGVFMASITDFDNLITSAFAINGTERPAHDSYGIPREVFEKTASGLTPLSLRKFRRRMAGNAEIYRQFNDLDFNQDIVDDLQAQLFSILALQDSRPVTPIPWKKAYIAKEDMIFPSENQRKFWLHKGLSEQFQTVCLDGSHYIHLDKIIRISIPATSRISRNFSDAASSYDDNAEAQKILAAMLTDIIKESGFPKGMDILEIGSGTGLFTSLIIREFEPSHLDLVDISDVRPSISKIPSAFYKADAESWIESRHHKYDAIFSSATVQWFVNLPRFIRNSAKCLKNSGVMAFSTFLPGNLRELDSLRPSPIHYHSCRDIRVMMEKYFNNIQIAEKEIILKFPSPSELFRHLTATGVGGSAPSSRLPISKIRDMKSLTFRCACFMGVKKQCEE